MRILNRGRRGPFHLGFEGREAGEVVLAGGDDLASEGLLFEGAEAFDLLLELEIPVDGRVFGDAQFSRDGGQGFVLSTQLDEFVFGFVIGT